MLISMKELLEKFYSQTMYILETEKVLIKAV